MSFPGLSLACADDVGQRLERRVGVDRQPDRLHRDKRNGDEVLARVVLHLVAQKRRDGDRRGGREHQGVAIGGGAGERRGSDLAARPSPVLGRERLPHALLQMVDEHPRQHIGGAAGAERHDDPDRRGGIRLRDGGCRGQHDDRHGAEHRGDAPVRRAQSAGIATTPFQLARADRACRLATIAPTFNPP